MIFQVQTKPRKLKKFLILYIISYTFLQNYVVQAKKITNFAQKF
jgi:hypothetical protein